MKFFCYKKDLSDALNFVTRAVAIKPQTPVLSGVYLNTEGSALELQANNFTTGIIARIPVNVTEPGSVVVGGKRLSEFVKNIPDADIITLAEVDNALTIDTQATQVSLLTMNVDDFPTVKRPDSKMQFLIRADRFHHLLRRTIFAVSKDESRPVFTGVNFAITNGCLSAVSTNTHRIAIARQNLGSDVPDCNVVIPAATLASILAFVPNSDSESVEINFSPKYATFAFENVFVTSRLIEGQFPPPDRVIPKDSATQFTADAKEFLAALNFIKLMSKETEFNTVRLVIANGAIELSASSNEVGNAVKKISANVSGVDLDIAFNIDYLIDVLKVIDFSDVRFECNDHFSPIAVTEPGNDRFIYVATPVRT